MACYPNYYSELMNADSVLSGGGGQEQEHFEAESERKRAHALT